MENIEPPEELIGSDHHTRTNSVPVRKPGPPLSLLDGNQPREDVPLFFSPFFFFFSTHPFIIDWTFEGIEDHRQEIEIEN